MNSAGLLFLGNSQGANSTQAICGSSLGMIENSETLSLVVGLVIMFILVIYSRLARVHLTVNHSNDVQYSNLVLVKFVLLSIEIPRYKQMSKSCQMLIKNYVKWQWYISLRCNTQIYSVYSSPYKMRRNLGETHLAVTCSTVLETTKLMIRNHVVPITSTTKENKIIFAQISLSFVKRLIAKLQHIKFEHFNEE